MDIEEGGFHYARETIEPILGEYGWSHLMVQMIRFFLRNPYYSVVLVDKEGAIQFMDRGSERFFHLSQGEAKGVQVTEVIEDSLMPETLQSKTPIFGRMIEIGEGERRIASAYPLIRDGELIGAVGRLVFRSPDEVNRLHDQIIGLKEEVHSLRSKRKQEYRALYAFENILGTSDNIRECIELAKKVATTGNDVLIEGESGTGKELFAHSIHNFTHPDKAFVVVNSPAIPFDLAESELFGYKKGAFSGASSTGKTGKIELANNGTLFLDETSTLPLSIQAKLLRVLEEREIQALGSTRSKRVNFQLISATNEDLPDLVDQGKFRMDLYYRIAKIRIRIDPLRKRREDIPILITHILNLINRRLNTRFVGVSDEALSCLIQYDWPGNTRELINVLEQACLKKWKGKTVTENCLPSGIVNAHSRGASPKVVDLKEQKEQTERNLISQALKKTNGNKRQAAFSLGMPRSTLYKKIKDYKL